MAKGAEYEKHSLGHHAFKAFLFILCVYLFHPYPIVIFIYHGHFYYGDTLDLVEYLLAKKKAAQSS